jgi:sec-independent protein translocase protein TatB
MLDLGLTKMAVIGVVSLVVLGPERLPRVARTAGALFGRAQRYINEVKDEVTREIELSELRQVKSEFVAAAANIESAIHENLREQQADLKEAWNGGSAGRRGSCRGARVASARRRHMARWHRHSAETQELAWEADSHADLVQTRRREPYARQSVAARVARHSPAYPAVRQGFFNV